MNLVDLFTINGTELFVPELEIKNIQQHKVMYDKKQTDLVTKLAKDKTVLDIGANIGYMSVVMGKVAKLIHAFEPDPDNLKILLKNLEYHNITNYRAYQYAVSNTHLSETDLYHCEFNHGMHRIYSSQWCNKNNKIRVPTIKIDEIIKDPVDFIKLDVEGSELKALKGMEKTLLKYHPTLMMEFHPPSIIECSGEESPEYIFRFLKKYRYENYRLLGDDNEKWDYIPNMPYKELENFTRNKSAVNILFT